MQQRASAKKILVALYKICAERALNKPLTVNAELLHILQSIGIKDLDKVCEEISRNRKYLKHIYYLLLKFAPQS